MPGTAPDEEITRRMNRTPLAVRDRRKELHIRVFSPKRRPYTPDEDKLLGTRSLESERKHACS